MSLLELRGVTKSYDSLNVVDNFDFSVESGELRCLLGPNGAGKTTSIDLITGRQRVTSGTIIFDGEDITHWREHQRARAGIGRKFQVPAVFKDLTVFENFEVASSRQTNPFSNMTKFTDRLDGARFEEVIELVGLKHRLADRAGDLSHGETQWLEIGMVLCQSPRLLLMDEPTAGMTESETKKTGEIFKMLRGTHTLIVVEHDMSFVRDIADVITVMHMGHTLAQGRIAEIETHPTVKEVYLGRGGISHA
jgi:urea transport system ATP-binding protein